MSSNLGFYLRIKKEEYLIRIDFYLKKKNILFKLNNFFNSTNKKSMIVFRYLDGQLKKKII